MKRNKPFKVFIWNETIHYRFTALLIFVVLLLCLVSYVQSLKIDQLQSELALRPTFDDSTDYNYDVVPLEEFFKGSKETPESITTIYKYLVDNNYDKVYLTKGFVEGEIIKDCHIDSRKLLCTYELLRFNQKKGKYIEVITKQIEK